MKVTVLIDNKAQGDLWHEWGLSFLIENDGKKILFDAGKSGRSLINARNLHEDVKDVDLAVLSHAHYDHGDGFDAFLDENQNAKIWLRAESKENCYDTGKDPAKYIGLRHGFLEEHKDRLHFVDQDTEILPNVWLIGHHLPGIEKISEKSGMSRKTEDGFVPDSFDHEQSLVIRTPEGLVIFGGCAHAGSEIIIREVEAAFPGEKLLAYFGGLHLFSAKDDRILETADFLDQSGLKEIYTGHCTGDHAYGLLQERLGDRIHEIAAGLSVTL